MKKKMKTKSVAASASANIKPPVMATLGMGDFSLAAGTVGPFGAMEIQKLSKRKKLGAKVVDSDIDTSEPAISILFADKKAVDNLIKALKEMKTQMVSVQKKMGIKE